jgi:integrase
VSRRQRRVRGSGSIYAEPGRGWVGEVSVVDAAGKRVRRRVRGESREAVQRQLDQLRGAPVDRTLLHGYLTWYVETYLAQRADLGEIITRSVNSARTGLGHVRRCTPLSLRLDELNAEQLDLLRMRLAAPFVDEGGAARHLARSTQSRILSQFSTAVDVAVYYGLANANRVRMMKRPKVPKRRRDILTPDQAKLLLDDVAGELLEPWYVVALPAGMRRAEALGLAWDDVDLEAGRLTLTHQLQRVDGVWVREPLKGRDADQGREVALAGFQVEVLRRHRLRQRQEQLAYEGAWGNEWDLVVVDHGGVPIWGDRVWRDVVARTKRLGLPRLTPHSLRRSALSLLLAKKLDIGTAMQMLGWQSSAIALEVYAQATKTGLDEAARIIGELYGD